MIISSHDASFMLMELLEFRQRKVFSFCVENVIVTMYFMAKHHVYLVVSPLVTSHVFAAFHFYRYLTAYVHQWLSRDAFAARFGMQTVQD